LTTGGDADMNYTRRPNRPDANHYRDMRRRGIGQRSSSGRSGSRRGGNLGALVVLVIVACAALIGVDDVAVTAARVNAGSHGDTEAGRAITSGIGELHSRDEQFCFAAIPVLSAQPLRLCGSRFPVRKGPTYADRHV
jgi:predicted metalloprotease